MLGGPTTPTYSIYFSSSFFFFSFKKPLGGGIEPIIRTRRESWCLQYVGLLIYLQYILKKSYKFVWTEGEGFPAPSRAGANLL